MSVQFRLTKMRRDDNLVVSVGHMHLHNFRKSLAQAIGFKKWVDWQAKAMKESFSMHPNIEDPPKCTWGFMAQGFDAFCNQSDCEGKIKFKDMESLNHLFCMVQCIPPFNGDPSRISQIQDLDRLREEMERLTTLGLRQKRCLVWD